jgi:hypothetical protein
MAAAAEVALSQEASPGCARDAGPAPSPVGLGVASQTGGGWFEPAPTSMEAQVVAKPPLAGAGLSSDKGLDGGIVDLACLEDEELASPRLQAGLDAKGLREGMGGRESGVLCGVAIEGEVPCARALFLGGSLWERAGLIVEEEACRVAATGEECGVPKGEGGAESEAVEEAQGISGLSLWHSNFVMTRGCAGGLGNKIGRTKAERLRRISVLELEGRVLGSPSGMGHDMTRGCVGGLGKRIGRTKAQRLQRISVLELEGRVLGSQAGMGHARVASSAPLGGSTPVIDLTGD